MKISTKIKSPIKNELSAFNVEFRKKTKSEISLLNIITKILLKRKRDHIRPVLVILSAKLISQTNDSTYNAASLIELLHTATLIHDDVTDDSNIKRSLFSINPSWKSKISVLLGDYLLAKGLLLAVSNKEFQLLEIISEAVKEISEGELIQIHNNQKPKVSESEYFDFIVKKTPALFAACTASGAQSVTEDSDIIKKLKEFGLNLGIAYQIKEDLLTYKKGRYIGNSNNSRVINKFINLPLVHSLQKVNQPKQEEIINIISKISSNRNSYHRVSEFVHQHNGIEYSRKKMLEYKNKSLTILSEFPDTRFKNSLEKLVYTLG